jgi:hypothetical protein
MHSILRGDVTTVALNISAGVSVVKLQNWVIGRFNQESNKEDSPTKDARGHLAALSPQ